MAGRRRPHPHLLLPGHDHRDFARFGLLYLHGGRWGDRQVVPADYVEDSLAGAPNSPDLYGFQWWLDDPEGVVPHAERMGLAVLIQSDGGNAARKWCEFQGLEPWFASRQAAALRDLKLTGPPIARSLRRER